MKSDERENFLKWYEERVNKKYAFYFNKELIEYSRSDVAILQNSILQVSGRLHKIGKH